MIGWTFSVNDNVSPVVNKMIKSLEVAGVNSMVLKQALLGFDKVTAPINGIGGAFSKISSVASRCCHW